MDDENKIRLFGFAAVRATHAASETSLYSGYTILPDNSAVQMKRKIPLKSTRDGHDVEIWVSTFKLEDLAARNANLVCQGFDNTVTAKALDDLQRAQGRVPAGSSKTP
jgi:hypothetical protein